MVAFVVPKGIFNALYTVLYAVILFLISHLVSRFFLSRVQGARKS